MDRKFDHHEVAGGAGGQNRQRILIQANANELTNDKLSITNFVLHLLTQILFFLCVIKTEFFRVQFQLFPLSPPVDACGSLMMSQKIIIGPQIRGYRR